MATAKETKRAIAEAFKDLLAGASFEQIRVGEICAASGRNRKSFYYYFEDKYDLICWIFDTELIAGLRDTLLREDMDFREVSLYVLHYFYENRTIYRKILPIRGQNSFREHFGEMLGGFVRERMGFPSGDNRLQRFCTDFYTDAILLAIEKWLTASPTVPPEEFLSQLRACLGSYPRDEEAERGLFEAL